MIVAVFGVFIALSSMTTLRGESSVGLIDIGLIASAAATIASSFVNRGRLSAISSLTSNPVYCFVGLGMLSIIVSTLINFPSYGTFFIDPVKAVTPFIATLFCAMAMSLTMTSSRALILLRAFVIASLLIGVIYIGGGLIGFGPFFYGPRFSGLSLNPNQTAMFALSASLTALVLFTKAPRTKLSLVYLAAFGVSMIVGVMTLSDAFMICSVLIMFCVAYLIALRFTQSFLATIVLGVFAAILGVVAVASFAPDMFGRAVDMVQASFATGNQDSDRELLWRNGLIAWGEKPVFGNGAGAWSGISGPFQAVEAHNSFIDWLSMVGLLGSIPLAYCVLSIFKLNFRRHVLSYIGVTALLAFFMFHFVFRLPPIWLAWMALLASEVRNEGAIFPSFWFRRRAEQSPAKSKAI